MNMNAVHDEGSTIVSRMRELRSAGQRDVVKLHAQAERVTDWREHVRAQPVVTAISSTVVGYMVVRALAGAPSATPSRESLTTQPFVGSSPVAQRASMSAGLLSLASGIALTVGRQWVTEYLKKQLGVSAHGHQSHHSDQRSNTPA